MRTDGSDVRQLTHTTDFDGAASFSPGGRKIVFVSGRHGDDDEVFSMRADGSHVRQLTRNQRNDFLPVYSPSGRRIAYSHSTKGDLSFEQDLFIMRADGTHNQKLIHGVWCDWGRVPGQ